MGTNTAGWVRAGAIATALVVAATGCSGGGGSDDAAAPTATTRRSTTTSTTEAPTTTTTEAPATTATTAKPTPDGLAQGARGEQVRALEQRLVDLKFDPGRVDGVYDSSTFHAVMAFQKTWGMARTGRATQDVIDRINSAGEAPPMLPSGGSTRVEVDLKRQILLLFKGGSLFRVVDVSTGSGKRYCVDGECATAVTPGGSFRVTRRISGWRTSRLGKLYNPLYFNGGIAIHGAPSVPATPASHGCVRIPMYVSSWFPAQVPNGTPVYVIGGPKAPVPFNEPAPGEAPPTTAAGPPPTSAPTTSAPSTSVAPTTQPPATAATTTSTPPTTGTAPAP